MAAEKTRNSAKNNRKNIIFVKGSWINHEFHHQRTAKNFEFRQKNCIKAVNFIKRSHKRCEIYQQNTEKMQLSSKDLGGKMRTSLKDHDKKANFGKES